MLKLSATGLNLLNECERCFWLLKVKEIKRPEGIFPSLPGGMDKLFKVRYDRFRQLGKLPPEIAHMKDVQLFQDQGKLNKWRNAFTGVKLSRTKKTEMTMAIDDLLLDSEDRAIVIDYKTRGYAPKPGAPDYYGLQLNVYGLGIKFLGFKLNGKACLAYYWPKENLPVSKDFSTVDLAFDFLLEEHECDPKKAMDMILKAEETAEKAIMPAPGPECKYCKRDSEMLALGTGDTQEHNAPVEEYGLPF